ncbi:hypothetical protein OCK74_08605 [Chitinophagaceae bacterium LB-8]|uniref:Uncharacterized protein n=1 Tax=Paraflavisolibacter caeni TaxID=2982496 RepID=A0A9X3BHU1_9BACT|nr:hypothetical protein [Paraflavisolibacter caeni]MCU7549173.1 hypothetical protein [Paraflavisolibacter caeni]
MKILVSILLTALLSFIAGIYFPWWSIAVVAFLVAILIRQPIVHSFLSGFLGIFILWTVLALWIDVKNNSILSQKIAQLFSLSSPFLLIIATAFIGALVGGFAAMSGSSLTIKSKQTV